MLNMVLKITMPWQLKEKILKKIICTNMQRVYLNKELRNFQHALN